MWYDGMGAGSEGDPMCKDLVSQKLSSTTAAVQSAVLALPRGQLMRVWTRCLALLTSGAAALPQAVQPLAARAGIRARSVLVREDALRLAPTGALLLALLVATPTLWAGWSEDDLLQRMTLSSASLPTALSRLYVFLDPATNAARMDSGVLPWWTMQSSKVAFWRPLTALSLWLDYRLWPESSLLMHAHNALWYALTCAAAAFTYLRFSGTLRPAGLAVLLFTLSVTHINSVGPLASRNILLAACFGLLTLTLHDRWRRERHSMSRLLAPASLALALLCSEAAVAAAAYLLAYAACLDRAPLRKRLASLLPYAGVILAWLAVHRWKGYGAYGSAFYVDPLREPLSFLKTAAENAPVPLFGQWIAPDPAVYAVLSPAARRVLWSLAALSMGFIAWLLWPVVRKDSAARYFSIGMLVSLLPVCAVGLPSGRHLMFVGFGALGLLAQFVEAQLDNPIENHPRKRRSTVSRISAFVLLGLHGFLYPVVVPLARQPFDALSITMADLGPMPGETMQTAVIVNMPSPGQLIYVPGLRKSRGQQVPSRLRALAPGYSAVQLQRLDTFTLLVRPEHGYLARPGSLHGTAEDWLPLAHPSYAARYGDGLFRSPSLSAADDYVDELSGMTVEVTQLTEDGRPLEAKIRFDVPLEDSSLFWLRWDWRQDAYVPFVPPVAGERVYIAGPT
jgi:hypothetical protein